MAKSPNTLGVELDLPPEWPVYTAAEREAVSDLVGRGRTFDYGRGLEIGDLEDRFSALLGGRHVLAVNSGMSALLAGYYALGLGPGDEVIVGDLGFLASVAPCSCSASCRCLSTPGRTRATSLRPRWPRGSPSGPVR